MHNNNFFLDIAKRILRIDHPASRDLRTMIKALNSSIEDVKDASFYTSKAEMDKGEGCWLPDSARRAYEATLRDI